MFAILFLLSQLVRQLELNPSELIIKGFTSDFRTTIYFNELRKEIDKLKDRIVVYIYHKGNCIPYEDTKVKQLIE